MFFKRVHITAEQQQQGITLDDVKAAVIAECEAAGFHPHKSLLFGHWLSERRTGSFPTARAAKAAHTRFDKRECGDDPEFQVFASITCEFKDGSGRCHEFWAQLHKAA